MFGYGCLTTALMLYAYFSFAVLRRHDVPEFITRVGSAEMWIYVAGAHMLTFVATLAGGGMGERAPLWNPLIPPTTRSILVGRIILLAATCNFLFWVPYIYLRLDDRGAPWCAVAAMLLLSTTYTAVHWALRPENIFSWPILRFLSSPLSFLTTLERPVVNKAIARRPAMPFDAWLQELLRCCERAVTSKGFVNSESPEEGEIDCLQFRALVLDDLGSRTCVLRYKRRMSRDEFRAIQRFLRAVASLDRRRPARAVWQGVIVEARSVLALKGTLTKENARASMDGRTS